MYERKLGIVADCIRKNDPVETLGLIKRTGFDSFFTSVYDEREVGRLKEESERLDLTFEFIHSPFNGVNSLWLAGEEYRPLYDGIIRSIDSAAKFAVPSVILHVSSGWTPPAVNDIGLARYDSIVAHAKEKGVCVAFENLRKLGNLACLMDRYENEKHVGFCYDIGHEHCYTETIPFLDLYANRLVCTHLHDNFGKTDPLGEIDLHLLPFDGNVDFPKAKKRLDECGYTGSLMLEVFDHRQYERLSAEAFIQTAFTRAQKLLKL